MYKTYLITFDPISSDPTPVKLVEYIRAHAYTYQFYTLNIGSIFIKSQAEKNQIIDSYKDFMAPTIWTISQIDNPAVNIGGSAPMPFWHWVNSDNPPPLGGQA